MTSAVCSSKLALTLARSDGSSFPSRCSSCCTCCSSCTRPLRSTLRASPSSETASESLRSSRLLLGDEPPPPPPLSHTREDGSASHRLETVLVSTLGLAVPLREVDAVALAEAGHDDSGLAGGGLDGAAAAVGVLAAARTDALPPPPESENDVVKMSRERMELPPPPPPPPRVVLMPLLAVRDRLENACVQRVSESVGLQAGG